MGLVPDGGSTFTLSRLTGLGQALRLLMAGDTLDAERARAIGVVDDVLPPEALDAGVQSLLGGIAGAAPGSLRAIKRLVRAPEVGALEQAMAAAGAAQLQALQSPEFRRRLESFTSRLARSEPA
jgi:enoyl-CoA hydratase/carnithine racemase